MFSAPKVTCNVGTENNMTKIKFKPWVGSKYQNSSFGIKILVLGESMYQWKEDEPINDQTNLISENIQEQIDGDWTSKFWTNIAIAFLGESPTLAEKGEFWNSVAFYNYVQESVGFGARVRPSEEKWSNGKEAFQQVLNSLQPDLIVVLGYELWDQIPDFSGKSGPIIEGDLKLSTWWYPLQNKHCLAIGIKHPSAGFNGRTWHPYITRAIQIQSQPVN
jgi:hypothetical protein